MGRDGDRQKQCRTLFSANLNASLAGPTVQRTVLSTSASTMTRRTRTRKDEDETTDEPIFTGRKGMDPTDV